MLAGNVSFFLPDWKKLTSDQFILQCIKGVEIPFLDMPFQRFEPEQYFFDNEKSKVIQDEIDKLLAKKAIVEIFSVENCFISNIFTVPKPDGSHRVTGIFPGIESSAVHGVLIWKI